MQSEMKAYYAQRADYYDDVYLKPERKADITRLGTLLPERLAGRDVLEVACGTGFWSQFIAPRAQRYVATDGVAEPLAHARRRLGGVCDTFVVADAYALPASLGSFSAAFAGLWFSHVPVERRSAFFHSLHARLLPGARVLLIDNSEAQLVDYPLMEHDAHGNSFQHRRLKDGSLHRVLKNFPAEHEMHALAKGFGASQARFERLENFWLFEYDLP